MTAYLIAAIGFPAAFDDDLDPWCDGRGIDRPHVQVFAHFDRTFDEQAQSADAAVDDKPLEMGGGARDEVDNQDLDGIPFTAKRLALLAGTAVLVGIRGYLTGGLDGRHQA